MGYEIRDAKPHGSAREQNVACKTQSYPHDPHPDSKHRRGTRGARYISASTKGLTIAISGASAFNAAFALTPADPRCTGSPLTCTFVIDLAPGAYAASVNTYDLAPVSGAIPADAKLLLTAQNVPTIQARPYVSGTVRPLRSLIQPIPGMRTFRR